ncbi:MAG: zinc ribbon domain-containing protein [Desulfococcaceae bacterium]
METVVSASICPHCGFSAAGKFDDCPRCGIVIEKYLRLQQERGPAFDQSPPDQLPPEQLSIDRPVQESVDEEFDSLWSWDTFQTVVLHVPEAVHPIAFGGRVLLFLGLLILGGRYMLSPLDFDVFSGFLHLINLPFHEAGHLIFRPFGDFITSLGGTLGQLLMPTICTGVFLLQTRDPFAGSVGLWWVGQNFMDIGPYINDARAGVMPLLGGNTGQSSPYGFHDWEYLLTETGLIRYDHTIALLSHGLGCLLMVSAFVWGGYLLWEQYHRLNSGANGSP